MKVECTWGPGPDVVLSLEGTSLVLGENPNSLQRWSHGIIREGEIDLTANQAFELGNALIDAAEKAKKLTDGISKEEFDKKEK